MEAAATDKNKKKVTAATKTADASMKRPAAAATAPLKRPAVAAVSKAQVDKIKTKIKMNDVMEKLRGEVGKISRSVFCSRAYDTAKRRMVSGGASDKDAALVARYYASLASKLYSGE